jgi:GDP-L-fucose synthase
MSTIFELARMVAEAVGFSGEVVCDPTRPDGTPRKLMDSRRLSALGWTPKIALREGIETAYTDFLKRYGVR